MTPEISSEQLLVRLDALFKDVEAMDFHISEESAQLSLVGVEVPRILGLLERGVTLLEDIQQVYTVEGEGGEGSTEESLEDLGAMISNEVAARTLADLGWVARGELQGRRRDLKAAVAAENHLLTATYCDDGLHRIRRMIYAMESAICEIEERHAPIRELHDLQLALQMRKLYRALRVRIAADGPPTKEALGHRLQDAAQSFSELRTNPLYHLIRIDDRVYLRSLHQRIQAWQEAGQDPVDGRHLFQDALGFSQLLAQVSQRQELVAHDRELLDKVWRALFRSGDPPPTVPQTLHHEMLALVGLEEELDQLLLQLPEHTPAERLREPVERLHRRLQRGF